MEQVTPRLRQVVLDSTDARRAAEFWRQLLGLVYRPGQEPPPSGEDDPSGRDWLNLRLLDGTPLLAFQQVEALPPATWPATSVPQQLHLDTTVRDVAELDAVHERVLALGGKLRRIAPTTRKSRCVSTPTPTGIRSAYSSPTGSALAAEPMGLPVDLW